MRFRHLTIAVVVGLTGCGGGSGGGSDGEDISANQNPTGMMPLNDPVATFATPTNAAGLTEALTTRYTSASDFDVWRCDLNGVENVVAYALPAAGTLGPGMTGIEYSLTTGGETVFTWQALSADEIVTVGEDSGLEFSSTEYVFPNASTMSYQLLGSTISCTLVDNSVAFGGAAPQPTPPATITPTPTNDASPAQAPEGFSQLYAYNTFGFVGTSAQLVTEVIALFDDGRYTEDLATAFSQSVQASLAQNPSDWGQYRFTNGELNLRPAGDLNFEEESSDFALEPAGADTRLTGCYDAIGGSSGLDISDIVTLSISTYCFSQQGRFTNDSSVFISSPNLISGGGNDRSGTYRIDGYAMRLRYDNGSEVTVSFSYMSDDRTHIGVNGKRFIR